MQYRSTVTSLINFGGHNHCGHNNNSWQ